MEKGNLSSEFFTYKEYHKFTDQDYILAVKDEDHPDKNVISILYRNGQTVKDIDLYDMGDKVYIVRQNKCTEILPLGERFTINQLLKISYGNIIYNTGYEENTKYPKVKTFHSNLNEVTNNDVIEIFRGKINEARSSFEIEESVLGKLLLEVYIGSSNCFFITEDNQTMLGPFIATKKDKTGSFIIEKSYYMKFGEYKMEDKSFISFYANDIKRILYLPGVNELSEPKNIDFISDEELLKSFENKIISSSSDYNIEILNSFIDFIRKSNTIIDSSIHSKRNERLLGLINSGEINILSNIDFIERLPKMKIIKDEIDKLSGKKLLLNTEISKLKKIQEDLQQETESEKQELENIKLNKEKIREEELVNQKIDLENEIDELEKRKANLSSFVEEEESKLVKQLDILKEEIKYKKQNQKELEIAIQSLRKEFVDKQVQEQEYLSKLVEHKKYFDFLSGRDISSYKISNESSFPDLRVVDKGYEDYISFRNKILDIFARNNRKIESHFLDNLLISIHQNTLTLLAGLPGTGKTSLAKLLVRILAPSEKIREISVNRGWTSSKDLIGFFNPLTKRFIASPADVYSLLKQLDYECNNNLFLDSTFAYIILDEANLSPLEHYWSIFYNLTDSKVFENNYFSLDLGGGEKLKYPNNLRFIGTINYDQTTEQLSPRVIDRANIIRLKPEAFNIDNLIHQDIKKVLLSFKDIIDYFELLDFKDETNIAFDDEREKFFKELKAHFKKMNIYISPRVEISIKRYCSVAKRVMHDENKPIDYSIAQRLLPLINIQGVNAKQKLKDLLSILPEDKFEISHSILKDIISLGEEGEIYENQFNYFLTLSHA